MNRVKSAVYLYIYTGTTGRIISFNYPVSLLAGITYTVCIRREEGYCGLDYAQSIYDSSTTPDTTSFFTDNADTTAKNVNYLAAQIHDLKVNCVSLFLACTSNNDGFHLSLRNEMRSLRWRCVS